MKEDEKKGGGGDEGKEEGGANSELNLHFLKLYINQKLFLKCTYFED